MVNLQREPVRNGPRLGEETRETLRELGITEARIDRLLASGALIVPSLQHELQSQV